MQEGFWKGGRIAGVSDRNRLNKTLTVISEPVRVFDYKADPLRFPPSEEGRCLFVQIFSRISLAQSIWFGITPFLSLTLQMSGVISSTT